MFPIYRKYVGRNVWFKILNQNEFLEINQLGSKFLIHHINAQQYPEILLIQDMINKMEDRWEDADSEFIDGLLKANNY
ncbi:hypothetical protein [Crocinitomix catalasitica]|uniref:hypothetical protein n=1 Tax=Crocinitomix catalasitica TaxID=184607 RepID=UPI0004872091|nr:hypothetical protein [Crocinitomix catalasitica]